jgi:outer membrane protein assembly factor BamB
LVAAIGACVSCFIAASPAASVVGVPTGPAVTTQLGQNPAHTGLQDGFVAGPPLALAWKDAFVGRDILTDGSKYVFNIGTSYYYDYTDVVAFTRNMGKRVWGPIRIPTYSTYALGPQAIVFGGQDLLYCIDATTGRLRWKVATSNDADHAPVVVGNVVYTSQARYDLSTGRRIGAIDFLRVPGPHPLSYGGGRLFSQSHGWVQAFSASTGKRLWSRSVPVGGGGLEDPPMIYQGRLYVDNDATGQPDVLDAATGTVLGHVPVPTAVSGSVGFRQVWDVAADVDWLVAYRLSDGSELWRFRPQLSPSGQKLAVYQYAVANSVLYLTAGRVDNEPTTLVAVDAGTGKQLWTSPRQPGPSTLYSASTVSLSPPFAYVAGTLNGRDGPGYVFSYRMTS